MIPIIPKRYDFAVRIRMRICRSLWLVRSLAFIWWCVIPQVHAQTSNVKRDQTIVFFPAIAHHARDTNMWEVEIRGCVYEFDRRLLELAALHEALEFKHVEMTPAELETFKDRARLFLVDNKGGRRVCVRIGDKVYPMNKSKANGHFSGTVRLTEEQMSGSRNARSGGRIEFEALTNDGRVFKGSAELMDDDGISVISDIDDTIKITEVLRRHECLRNTFLEPFKPVPGMAEAYEAWAGKPGVLFHYVSASPWQLYFPLKEFVQSNGFPHGVFELKTFRLKDRTFMSLFESPEIYKLHTIEPMLKQFPKRHFVLVGDSGERDPEAYAALARRYRAQVSHIFIRNITGEGPDAPRFQKDFAGLPSTQWTVFKDPQELRAWSMPIRTGEPSDQK
jgi:hypothetical protein